MFSKALVALAFASVAIAAPSRRVACSNGHTASNEAVSTHVCSLYSDFYAQLCGFISAVFGLTFLTIFKRIWTYSNISKNMYVLNIILSTGLTAQSAARKLMSRFVCVLCIPRSALRPLNTVL